MERFSHWFQVAANVGILLGLVLVGGQMWQSNSIAASQLFVSNVQSTIDLEIAMMGEKADESMDRIMHRPETATAHDYYVADRVHGVLRRQLVVAMLLSEAGLYGGEDGIDPEGFVRANYVLMASHYGLASVDQLLNALERIENPDDFVRATKGHLNLMRELVKRDINSGVIEQRRTAVREKLARLTTLSKEQAQ